MMREIKFRAWDEARGEMINNVGYHPTICMINDGYTQREGGAFTISPKFYNYRLMQYIGKKDINGIEIYDGDKVRWTSGKHFWEAVIEPCRSHPEGQLYAIETINNLSVDEDTDIYTYEVTNSREGSRTEIAFLCRTIEVIGNIYETIKEGKE